MENTDHRQGLREWYFKQLMPNPLGGSRRVRVGRTITDADARRLKEKHPVVYSRLSHGIELGMVCYDDLEKALRRQKEKSAWEK